MLFGVHVSIADSIDLAIDRAQELGCDTFQIFTRNPRGWVFSELGEEDAERFRTKLKSSSLTLPLAHMPYLPNIASPVDETYNRSVDALTAELRRNAVLSIPYVVTHVGSHLGSGIQRGIRRVVRACNTALQRARETETVILLENTAGTKNSVGSDFEHLRSVIDGITPRKRVGICLDTCHTIAAGYDLRTTQDVNRTFKLFDRILGHEMLRAVHVNDSKASLGEGTDRHEHIGLGHIGEEGFRSILKHRYVARVPMILETPIDGRRDEKGNLRKLKRLAS